MEVSTCLIVLSLVGICSSYSTAPRNVRFDRFEVGQGVEVEYGTPSDGKIAVDLYPVNGDDNDILLHFNMRYDERVLVLNTHVGNWGAEERFTAVDFTPGRLAKVKLVACDSGINVYFDGNFVTRYNYRHGHTASSIQLAVWVNQLQTAQLKSIKVINPPLRMRRAGYSSRVCVSRCCAR